MKLNTFVIANTSSVRGALEKYLTVDERFPTNIGYLYVNIAVPEVKWSPSAHTFPAEHAGVPAIVYTLLQEHGPEFLMPSTGEPTTALDAQVGGGHYMSLKIQPAEYSEANGLSTLEAKVVKYISRHRNKGGLQDLHKAKHSIDLLIQFIKDGTVDYPEELKNV